MASQGRLDQSEDRAMCASADALPAAYLPGLAPLEIDVEIHPRVRIEGVVFVAQNPWMNDDVLKAISVKFPRGVRGDQRRHAAEKLHPLRAVRQPLGLVVERIELRKVEPTKVRDALVWTV